MGGHATASGPRRRPDTDRADGSALGPEELSQPLGALRLEDPAGHRGTVVQPMVPHDVPQRGDGPGLGVVGTEDDPLDARLHRGSRAHGARLEGDDESVAVETPRAEVGPTTAEHQHLSMGGRVARLLALVPGDRHDLSGRVEQHRSDRRVARGGSGPGGVRRSSPQRNSVSVGRALNRYRSVGCKGRRSR